MLERKRFIAFNFFRRPYELRDPKNKTLTPEELLKLQTTNPLVETREERIRREDDRNNWLGVMTPRETGRMLETIELGVVVSKPASGAMKAMRLAQQAGTRRIPHFITVPVAHKTGDGPPIIANDVGIVYARSGPIVISFFTTNDRELYADLEDRMGRTARLMWITSTATLRTADSSNWSGAFCSFLWTNFRPNSQFQEVLSGCAVIQDLTIF